MILMNLTMRGLMYDALKAILDYSLPLTYLLLIRKKMAQYIDQSKKGDSLLGRGYKLCIK